MPRILSILILLWLVTIATAQKPELVLPIGHVLPVTGVCFSPNGKLVVTNGGEEKCIKIWETQSGKLIKSIEAHSDIITSVSFSPDGNLLLTTSHDQTAKVRDVHTGEQLYSAYYNFSNWIQRGFFTSDGKSILLVSDDAMELHSLVSKKMTRYFLESPYEGNGLRLSGRVKIYDCDFSSNGKFILTISSDSTVKIWDSQSGKIIYRRKESSSLTKYAAFSHSGEKYLLCSNNEMSVWETSTHKLLASKKVKDGVLLFSKFLPDDKKVVTAILDINSGKNSLELWDISTGDVLQSYKNPGSEGIYSIEISPDGKRMLTTSGDKSIRLWDIDAGFMVRQINKKPSFIDMPGMDMTSEEIAHSMVAIFSTDSRLILSSLINNVARVEETMTGKVIAELEGISSMVTMPKYSPDGKLLATVTSAFKLGISNPGKVLIWELTSGRVISELHGHLSQINDIKFSQDGKLIATASEDSTVRIWDVYSGKLVKTLAGHEKGVYSCFFAENSNCLVSQTFNGKGRIWNIETGKLIKLVTNGSVEIGGDGIYKILPSRNGKYLIANFYSDDKSYVFETASGKELLIFDPKIDSAYSLTFDPSEKFLLYRQGNRIVVKDIYGMEGERFFPVAEYNGLRQTVDNQIAGLAFNKKGNMIAIKGAGSILDIMEFPSGKLLTNINTTGNNITNLSFTHDDRFLLTYFYDSTVKVWDVKNGSLVNTVKIGPDNWFEFGFERSGKNYFVTRSTDNIIGVWDVESGKNVSSVLDKFNSSLNYIFNPQKPQFVIDNKFSVDIYDFGSSTPSLKIVSAGEAGMLCIDSAGHYDGDKEARNLLYFTCGTEIINLDQVKDQLWIPGLMERVFQSEPVSSKGLFDLNICNLTPIVKDIGHSETEYKLQILPRLGGIGETVLCVNGIEVKRFTPSQMIKKNGLYELAIDTKALQEFFIPGRENSISIKAYTADNQITSRSVIVGAEQRKKQSALPPNLYAVIVGVSDYKGDELDLNYAAKDANDISKAIAISARKLLETDTVKHVFVYNLTTAKEHYLLPEKQNIKQTLGEIGTRAKPNDILLVFFAGHGKMETTEKQFYFLTAEASRVSVTDKVAEVGISTSELAEWIKPGRIKAQKRVLIFDACNSGQAINDLVKVGNDDQNYVAARDDGKAEQIKAVEKLNEKSGLFIISASASDQKAYEMGRFSQGVLTYSLLKAIKLQPDILEDGKYLDVSRWFNAAERTVVELAKEGGIQQQPQVVSTTNFDIGLVDTEVLSSIDLPDAKPIFTACNFQNNDRTIADDDLDLSRLVNLQLSAVSSRSVNSPIVYVTATQSPDAYTMTGGYDIKGNEVIVTVNIKQGRTVKHRFEINGDTNKLKDLANSIVDRASSLLP